MGANSSILADMKDFESRLQALEDLEAIRQLKARYLDACDRKDPDAVRACFVEEAVDIDFGPLGRFNHRDQLVAVYQKFGCHPHILDTHHGSNPQLRLLGPDRACGTWSLFFQQINLQEQRLVQLSVRYEDGYRKVNGAWLIEKTHSVTHSSLALDLSQEQLKLLFAAAQPPGSPV